MSEFRKVSKEEYEMFVKDYPNKLEKDVFGAAEPPVLTYNDFSNGKVWPESCVTKRVLCSGSYLGGEDEYYITELKL